MATNTLPVVTFWNKMPPWQCQNCKHINDFAVKKQECHDCSALNYCILLPSLPHTSPLAARARKIHRGMMDLGHTTETLPGTLTPYGILKCLLAVPSEERQKSILLDVGCGPGHVLCIGLLCGFKKYAGIERDKYDKIFEGNWQKATESAECGPRTPFMQWGVQAEDSSGFTPPFWDEPLVVYLFWSAFAREIKQSLTQKMIALRGRISWLILVDRLKPQEGHRCHMLSFIDGGFYLRGFIPVKMSGSTEKFLAAVLVTSPCQTTLTLTQTSSGQHVITQANPLSCLTPHSRVYLCLYLFIVL